LEDFNSDIEINKPWKIIWAQEIVISSQAMWSIKATLKGESFHLRK
jgi:hypothetical protein